MVITVKKLARIILIILLIALIGLCGIELWSISAVYLREAQVKDGLSAYNPGELSNSADSRRSDGNRNGGTNSQASGIHESGATAGGFIGQGPGGSSPQGETTQNRLIINQSIIDLQNEVNPSIAGWITVPGTHIDYPFVNCDNNDYYIGTDIYGNSASAGTLFTDSRCATDFTDFNTIIYGHNMRNNTMFGDLPQFSDGWFFDNHQTGTLYTQYDTYTLEIFACLIVRSDDDVIYSPNIEEDAFFDYVQEHARTFREPDRSLSVVTLSTCGYEFTDARIVIIASLLP